MSPSAPTVRAETGREGELERFTRAAALVARRMPSGDPTLGILRGLAGPEDERAPLVRNRLVLRGVRTVEVDVEAAFATGSGRRGRAGRPRVHALLHIGEQRHQHAAAMQAAALWELPLLIHGPCGYREGVPNTLGGHRYPVAGIHLPDGTFDIAVREAVIAPCQARRGSARLLLDNEQIEVPGGRTLRVAVDEGGEGRALKVSGDSFRVRRVRRLRYERALGPHRLETDEAATRTFRAPLRIEALPGRLHLLHP